MDFRKELHIRPFKKQLTITDKVLFFGSCFSENLGDKLQRYKFDVWTNPHGTLFNPISISRAVQSLIEPKHYTAEDIFFHQELWKSWDHHSQFSDLDQERMLSQLNRTNAQAHTFLKQTNWLILTLGSAWVYQNDEGRVVANCHKVPTDRFQKKLLSSLDIKTEMEKMIHSVRSLVPDIKIMFTISPVRHLRDGFIENNRSKANLIQAVHELIEEDDHLYYFPSYELIIDDLRDYRFYDLDMVHPNYLATDYVWEKFQLACIDEHSRSFFPEIQIVSNAIAHKPFQPDTAAHKEFRAKTLERVQKLKAALPGLNWQPEIDFLSD